MTDEALEEEGYVEPVPYTVDEFARKTAYKRRAVKRMISNGELLSVEVGRQKRIVATEFRRVAEEWIAIEEGMREALSRALRNGVIEEVGIDKRREVIYRRTDKLSG